MIKQRYSFRIDLFSLDAYIMLIKGAVGMASIINHSKIVRTNDPEGQGNCKATRATRTRAACYIVVREEGGARRWGQQGRYMRAPRWEACLRSKGHPHLRANKRV